MLHSVVNRELSSLSVQVWFRIIHNSLDAIREILSHKPSLRQKVCEHGVMPKRSSKRRDANETAFDALQQVISLSEEAAERQQKNPAAVALGRLGGLKGGRVRADRLSASKRREIAKRAAAARWEKKA